MARRRTLIDQLAATRPEVNDPRAMIAAGRVLVDGRVVTNPASMVSTGCSIVVRKPSTLRGEAKLVTALDAFSVDVSGRVALDVGAAAGGFTRALLARQAARVYAVDAGHGQLLGSLRADARVVNLEATNVAELDTRLIRDPIGVVTVDVSYLGLAAAVAQLDQLDFSAGADLVGLVKPMFELRLAQAPATGPLVAQAIESAASGVQAAGWRVVASMESPVRGARGAAEGWLHAKRS